MSLPVFKDKGSGLWVASGRISEFGIDDAEDNGVGAWGYPTGQNPMAPFCALPIPYIDKFGLEPGQQVTVEFKGRQVRAFLSDKGPAVWTGRLIDVSPSVLRRLRCQTDRIVKVYLPLGKLVPKEQWC